MTKEKQLNLIITGLMFNFSFMLINIFKNHSVTRFHILITFFLLIIYTYIYKTSKKSTPETPKKNTSSVETKNGSYSNDTKPLTTENENTQDCNNNSSTTHKNIFIFSIVIIILYIMLLNFMHVNAIS